MSDSEGEIYEIEEVCKFTFLTYGDVTEEFVETVLRPNLTVQTTCLFMFTWTLEDVLSDMAATYRDDFPEFTNEMAKVEAALFHLAWLEPGLVLSGPIKNMKISELNDLCAKHASESHELLVFEQGPGMPILGVYSTSDSVKSAKIMTKIRMGQDNPEEGGAVIANITVPSIFSLR